MKTKFTKGVWFANIINHTLIQRAYVMCDNEDERITLLETAFIGNFEEQKANAQLISAAPDLFEALINIENDDNRIPATIWEMRNKALNKALGEEVFKTKAE